jgi:hypothetical protein
MSKKDKKIFEDRDVSLEDIFEKSSNNEITSNTSQTTGNIPEFTSGDGDSSGGSSSDEND